MNTDNSAQLVDTLIRRLVREEVRRLVRPEALDLSHANGADDQELRDRASGVATRLRRAPKWLTTGYRTNTT